MSGVGDLIARGALHSGDVLPSVRALAVELGINQNTVHRAYQLLREGGLIDGRSGQGTRIAHLGLPGKQRDIRAAELRVIVARMIGETLTRGYTLAEVEASFTAQRANWQRESGLYKSSIRQWIGFGSHDLCLELALAQCQQLNGNLGIEFAAVGSMAGLIALGRGEAHFAAAHLYDPRTNDYNLSFVRQVLPGQAMVLLTMASRSQGLILAAANPKRLHALTDLARRGVRFINRPIGSGARGLIDQLMAANGMQARQLTGYADEAVTTSEAIHQLLIGQVDVAIGAESHARARGLDFVPLRLDRFELVMPRASEFLVPMLDVIQSARFKQAAAALGGYDLGQCGSVRVA